MRQLNFPAIKHLVAADGIEPSPCRLSADWDARNPNSRYETSVLPLELHQITGASSQSLTGLPGIQILRIDGNAYEAKRTPVLALDDTH